MIETLTEIHTEQVLSDLRLLHGALTPDEVAALVDRLEARGFAETGRLYPPSYRTNLRCVFDDADLADRLFARLRPHLPPEVVTPDGVRWRLAGLNPRFRACRYSGGQAFAIHRDGAQQPAARVRSFRTVMLYLDDGAYDGGRTRFFADRTGATRTATIVPRAGTAAVFGHDLWHDGEPVTGGVKRVFRTDVFYERRGAPDEATHAGYVWCLQPLPDGRLASGSRDAVIAIGRPEGGPVLRLRGHTASVTSLTLAGEVLWSGSRDGTVRRWSLDGAPLGAVDLDGGVVLALAPAADGVLAGTADGRLVRLDAEGTVVAEVAAHPCWTWAVIPHGAGFASAGEDGWVRIWSPELTPVQAIRVAAGPVQALLAAPDGGLVAGAFDGRLRIYDAGGGRVETRSAHTGAVTALTRLPDGVLVSGGEDDRVVLHRPGGPEVRRHGDFVRALAVTAEGRLVSGSYDATLLLHST